MRAMHGVRVRAILPRMKRSTVAKKALDLPSKERAKLARQLIESLENLSESEADKLWLDEAERRAADIDQGKAKLIPGEEVARKARALLK